LKSGRVSTVIKTNRVGCFFLRGHETLRRWEVFLTGA